MTTIKLPLVFTWIELNWNVNSSCDLGSRQYIFGGNSALNEFNQLPRGRLQINTHAPYVCGFAWSDMVHGCMVYTECAEMAAVPCVDVKARS